MTPRHWILTAVSFAAVVGVSLYMLAGWAPGGLGSAVGALPPIAHLLAAGTVFIEVATRALKLTLSARAVGIELPVWLSVRTSLGGDFGAAITPARSGAEPARFLILSEAKLPASSVLVVLFAELLLEAISLAIVVSIVAVVFHDAGPVLGALVTVVGGYSAFVIGLAVLALLLSRRSNRPAPGWARRVGLGGDRWKVVQRWLGQVRNTVDQVRDIDFRLAALSLFASVLHVAMRLLVLPALVLPVAPDVNIAPLALWPLGMLYGAAVVPAPGGGGAIEVVFRAALGGVVPSELFGASLLWWRFYTFYIYILLGAVAAGSTVLRAVRRTEDYEAEVESGVAEAA